jgi:hypothetical protein
MKLVPVPVPYQNNYKKVFFGGFFNCSKCTGINYGNIFK